MAKKEILFQVQLDTAQAIRSAAQFEARLIALADQQKEQTKTLTALVKTEQEQSKIRRALSEQVVTLKQDEQANREELQRVELALTQVTNEYNQTQDAIRRTSLELTNSKNTTAEMRGEYNRLRKESIAVEGSISSQRLELARLTKQYDTFRVGVDGTQEDFDALKKTINEYTDSVFNAEKETQRFQRGVGNYAGGIREAVGAAFDDVRKGSTGIGGALAGIGNSIKGLGFAGIAVGAAQAIAGAIGSLREFQQELAKTRTSVQQLTGATGTELDAVTAQAQATAQTFGETIERTIEATNAVAKGFGVEFSVAGEIIQKGFATGANVTGEFLDQLREYPVLLKEVGLNAEETVAIISQNVNSGIYADKGIDAIKEAGIAIRELTPVTRAAIDGIGISSVELEKGLREGSISSFEAIQKISGRLGELPPQSKEVGAALADIFKGAGEDAGLEYIKTLATIETGLDDVVKSGGPVVDAQLRQVQATERLNLVYNQLFGEAATGFNSLKATVTEFAADGLEAVISGVIELANYFIDLYNESVVFRGGIQAIGATFNALKETATAVLGGILDAFKGIGRLIGAVLRGEFSTIGGIISETFQAQGARVAAAGKDIAQGYVDAANNTVKAAKVERLSLANADAIKQAAKKGEEAGAALVAGLVKGVKSEQELIAAAALSGLTDTQIKAAKEQAEKIKQQGAAAAKAAADAITAQLAAQRAAIETELTTISTTQATTGTSTTDNTRVLELREQLAAITQTEAEFSAKSAEERLLAEAKYIAEVSRLRNEFTQTEAQRTNINAQAEIKSRLLFVRTGTQEELSLRRQLATLERDALLQDSNLSAEQRLLIEAEYVQRVTELNLQSIDAVGEESRRAALEQITTRRAEIETAIAEERTTREQAAAEFAELDRRTVEITTEIKREEINLARFAIEENRAIRTREIDERLAAETQALTQLREIGLLSEFDYQTQLATVRQTYDEQRRALEEETRTAEQERRREELAFEISLLDEGTAARLEKVAELAALEAEIVAQSEQQKRDEYAQTAATQQQVEDNRRKTIDASIQAIEAFGAVLTENTNRESKAFRAGVALRKAAALAATAIQTQEQIGAAILAGQKISAFAAPASVPVGIAYTVANVALAIANAARRVGEIRRQTFATGGQVEGIARGPRHSGGGIAGVVRPTGQPIEFEGGEFITNVAATTRNFDIIRQINADKGRTRFDLVPRFAIGGLVNGSAAGLSESTVNQISNNVNVEQMAAAFRAAVAELPAPALVLEEFQTFSKQVQIKNERAAL